MQKGHWSLVRWSVRRVIYLSTMLIAVAGPSYAASIADTRIIPDNITLAVPLFRCGVPSVAARLVRSAAIPAGIESVPDCAHGDLAPPPNLPPTITFLGKTVAEA